MIGYLTFHNSYGHSLECVTCHMSHVLCYYFFLKNLKKKIVGQTGETKCGGYVINGATPSSLHSDPLSPLLSSCPLPSCGKFGDKTDLLDTTAQTHL